MAVIYKWVKINNEDLGYIIEDIAIQQSYYNHHTFEVNLTIPTGEEFGINDLKKVLGEEIEISFSLEKDKSNPNTFKGLVDSATPYYVGDMRMLRLEGYSASILMDAGPRFRAFTEMSVADIVKKITQDYDIDTKIDASGDLPFILQCQESDYRFLCRLADSQNLAFYYDGDELHFDEFNDQKGTTKLQKKDIQALEATINLCPLSFEVKGYDYVNDDWQKEASPKRYGSNEKLVKAAIEKSAVYPSVKVNVNYALSKKGVLKDVEHQLATQQTNDLVTIRGRSANISLHIGRQLTIEQEDEKLLPGIDGNSAFIITHISHSISGDNSYRNSFTAVPADHPFPLNMVNAKPPICGPLTAIVKDIEDPDKLGRVRVQFMMDDNESLSPWMRVLTTYTSHGGSLWLPAVEERVVVFFEDFNPEKSPFVLNGFFNGGYKAADWKEGEKGFRMENISMIFNDKEGSLNIKAKSIILEGEESIELGKAKKIRISAQEVEAEAGQKMKLSGGQHLEQKATRIDLN